MISKSNEKIDAKGIVTGGPLYADDLPFPGNGLEVKVLRSPYAHARILEIDCEGAKRVPGVVEIFTYRDVPDIRYTSSGKSYPESSPYDRLILEEVVRYVGDEVALIAATTEKAANKARKLIKVKYLPLPPLMDPVQSEFNDIVVHPEIGLIAPSNPPRFEPENNIISQFETGKGDVEKELAQSGFTVDRTYQTQAQAHCMMETLRALSYYDELGRIVVIASTQVPFHAQRQIARALGLPVNKVRVVKPRIGGGFGGKTVVAVEPLAAFVTMKTGRPARLVYTRQENFVATTTRHAMTIRVRLGADMDGKLKALQVDNINNTGAYGEDGAAVTMVAANNILPAYNRTNAIRYVGKTVYTNTVPGSALRGYGATQSAFAIECAVNELAAKMKVDPVEFRRRNMAGLGDVGGILHSEIKSCGLAECITKGQAMLGWDLKYPRIHISKTKVRGVGMSITTHRTSIPNADKAGITLRLESDGTVMLFTGSADVGTGSDTVLAQIASEALGIPFERIFVRSGDTDSCPYDSGAYASSTTYVTGNAVKAACGAFDEKIRAAGASVLECQAHEVCFDGREVYLKKDEAKRVSLLEIASRSYIGTPEQVIVTKTYGSQLAPLPFAAGFAEVEVDLATGKVDLVDFVMVIDCGTVINPNLARIQAEGGAVMGIGFALFEDVRYNQRGAMMTNSFMQYKMPCRKDIENKVRVDFVESYEPSGPFGAKSVGEVVVHTPAPAIVHALYNAVGVWVRELPVTPEKVWGLLQDKSGREYE